jgi:guanylate kinase
VCNRRTDPETGDHYNLLLNPPKEDAIAKRLLHVSEDREDIVKARFAVWNEAVPRIEDAYKKVLLNIQTDNTPSSITDIISDAIQNPIG